MHRFFDTQLESTGLIEFLVYPQPLPLRINTRRKYLSERLQIDSSVDNCLLSLPFQMSISFRVAPIALSGVQAMFILFYPALSFDVTKVFSPYLSCAFFTGVWRKLGSRITCHRFRRGFYTWTSRYTSRCGGSKDGWRERTQGC